MSVNFAQNFHKYLNFFPHKSEDNQQDYLLFVAQLSYNIY